MKIIFEAVMNRLKEQVPELAWIDVNLGQLELENPPVDYPCALVDIPTINYENLGNRAQIGQVNVEIELYFQVATPSNMATPLDLRVQAAEHFTIVNKVYVALEGFAQDHFGCLNRRQFTRNKKIAPRGFVLDFVCTTTDTSACPVYTPVFANPILK